MELRAFLNDDGSAVLSVGEPGSMASAEIEWHSAELTILGGDGGVVRRVVSTVGGKPEVTGPEPAAEHPTETGDAAKVGTSSHQGETAEVKA